MNDLHTAEQADDLGKTSVTIFGSGRTNRPIQFDDIAVTGCCLCPPCRRKTTFMDEVRGNAGDVQGFVAVNVTVSDDYRDTSISGSLQTIVPPAINNRAKDDSINSALRDPGAYCRNLICLARRRIGDQQVNAACLSSCPNRFPQYGTPR